MKTGWKWFAFRLPTKEPQGHVTSHAVPQELAQDVLDDLRARYPEDTELWEEKCEDSFKKYRLDFGGIVHFEEPESEIPLPNGRILSFFSFHAPDVLEQVKKHLQDRNRWRRTKHGKVYLKLFGRWTCCCLTLSDARLVVKHLEANMEKYMEKQRQHEDYVEGVIAKSPNLTSPKKMAREMLTQVAMKRPPAGQA